MLYFRITSIPPNLRTVSLTYEISPLVNPLIILPASQYSPHTFSRELPLCTFFSPTRAGDVHFHKKKKKTNDFIKNFKSITEMSPKWILAMILIFDNKHTINKLSTLIIFSFSFKTGYYSMYRFFKWNVIIALLIFKIILKRLWQYWGIQVTQQIVTFQPHPSSLFLVNLLFNGLK